MLPDSYANCKDSEEQLVRSLKKFSDADRRTKLLKQQCAAQGHTPEEAWRVWRKLEMKITSARVTYSRMKERLNRNHWERELVQYPGATGPEDGVAMEFRHL